jgi:hypothetical protein
MACLAVVLDTKSSQHQAQLGETSSTRSPAVAAVSANDSMALSGAPDRAARRC